MIFSSFYLFIDQIIKCYNLRLPNLYLNVNHMAFVFNILEEMIKIQLYISLNHNYALCNALAHLFIIMKLNV